MIKIFKYFLRIVKELLFLIGLWSPSKNQDFEETLKKFFIINQKFWNRKKSKEVNVLIEGHLSEYGPNYLYRTALAAKAIEEKTNGATIEILVNGFSHEWKSSAQAYKSFGIDKWIYLGRKLLIIEPILVTLAVFNAGISFLKLRDPKSILDIKIDNIKVGDLIYDQVLRSIQKGTIKKIDFNVYKTMIRSWHYFYQYKLLFFFKNYDYYIATHTAYPEYGILCRQALKNNIIVIETSDIQMSMYDENTRNFVPTYHQGINLSISNDIKRSKIPLDKTYKIAREKLSKRFDNELDQIDSQKAFTGNVYDRESLNKKINFGSNKKIGFVFTHIFVDSPHLSESMLFPDYYVWLEKTLEYCSNSKDVTWIIKPHPSSASYGEKGMVEKMISSVNSSNIFICPDDFNTKSIINCADMIITVHGTAGLEFSCLGIPVILGGTPFYSGFGFAIEPKSIEEYENIIMNANLLSYLSKEKILKALQVFEAWERQFDWNNPIIDSRIQARVWGSGVDRDLKIAYEILNENLKSNDPRELKLWHFVSSSVKISSEG